MAKLEGKLYNFVIFSAWTTGVCKHRSILRKQNQALLAKHEISLSFRYPMKSFRQIMIKMPREMARCN